jgi:rRNA maturation endonuclease Nob1
MKENIKPQDLEKYEDSAFKNELGEIQAMAKEHNIGVDAVKNMTDRYTPNEKVEQKIQSIKHTPANIGLYLGEIISEIKDFENRKKEFEDLLKNYHKVNIHDLDKEILNKHENDPEKTEEIKKLKEDLAYVNEKIAELKQEASELQLVEEN